jgi:hypothetical protein
VWIGDVPSKGNAPNARATACLDRSERAVHARMK